MDNQDARQTSSLAQLLRSKLSPHDVEDLHRIFDRGYSSLANRSEQDYSKAFDSVLPTVLEHLSAGNQESAETLFAELLEHSPDRQRFLVRNSPRYLHPRLVDLLVEKSFGTCTDDPRKGLHLAEQAVSIAEALQPASGQSDSLLNDLKGKAWISTGNALRTLGKLQDSEQALSKAEEFLTAGSGDLLQLAYYHYNRASLLGNLGNYTASFQSFDRAIRIFAQCGESQAQSRSMTQKALFYGYAGETEKAIELLRAGIALADPEQNPRILIAAHHNLVLFLTDQGNTEEAKVRLEAIRPTYHQVGDKATLLRLRWLEGRISLAEKQLPEAEEAFNETRRGFVAQGIVWDAALVSLELASLYAEQKRTAEIQVLADEIIPLFKATGQQREALATLILFQKAAELERVSEQLIRATVAQLRTLRRDR